MQLDGELLYLGSWFKGIIHNARSQEGEETGPV